MRNRVDVIENPTVEFGYTGTDDAYHVLAEEQLTYSKISTCLDIVTPNFAKRMRDGEILNNPCTIQVTEVTANQSGHSGVVISNGKTSYTSGTGSANMYYGYNYVLNEEFSFPDVPVDYDSLIDAAKLQALSRIDKTPYTFAEDLAEITSTVRYLKEAVLKLKEPTKLFADAKKLLRQKHRDDFVFEKKAASLWLQFRFVITPLVMSIMDLLEAYNDQTVWKRDGYLTARGSQHYSQAANATQFIPAHFKWDLLRTFNLQIHAGVLYTIRNPLKGWRFKYGLRNKDIPVTMWNVVPLSFMYDRVQNISEGIKALMNMADPSIEILAGWVTVKREDIKSFHRLEYNWIDWDFTCNGSPAEYREFLYDRQPWKPIASDIVPEFKPGKLITDIQSLTDVLSIIVGRLK